jgi:phage terminase large subunit-like protein
LVKRARRDRVPWGRWSRRASSRRNPGHVVDYRAIEQRIVADAALFQVREIAYDPWNATHIALRLQEEGATMVAFRQGFRSMAAPTRELEQLIVSRKIVHGGNPVRPGAQVPLGGDTFVVQGEPERRDPDRFVWTLDVRPA